MSRMYKDPCGGADEQYSGYAPVCKGSTWIIDDKGTQQVAEKWRCYFGGGETLDIDGDGVPDTCARGEINVGGVCFWLNGMVNPRLIVKTNEVNIDSECNSGKVFEPYFQKYLKTEPFQTPFGKLVIKRIGECLDYKFCHSPADGTESFSLDRPGGVL